MSSSKVVSHGSIYLLGNILRRIVSFVMLPIYTTYLSPADYGTIELLSMVLDITAILLGLRISEAIFRFYNEYDDAEQQKQVVFTCIALVVALNAVGVLALTVAAGPISQLVFGSTDAARLLGLFSFTLVLQSLTETVFTYIRAQQKPWLFVGLSTVRLVVQLSLNIYFVVMMKMAVEGVILSALISGIVIALPMTWYVLSKTGIAFSMDKARLMTAFSIPLVITSLISFYITFGDRYFLRLMGGGLDEVGLYALGYKFGFMLSFIVGDPFFSVWDAEKYVAAKSPGGLARIQNAFIILTTGMVLVSVGISIFVHDVLRVMSEPEFWGAYLIVPIIMLAYVFNNWAAFSNLGLLLHKQTKQIAVGTGLSALVSTAGYLLLIPVFGAVGAAATAALAFGSRMVWVAWRSNLLHPLHLPWRRALAMLAFGVSAWLLSLLSPEPIFLSVVVNTLIFLLFAAILLLSPVFLPADLRREGLDAIRSRLGRRKLQPASVVPTQTVQDISV